jgi:hypothetical protein
VNFTSIAATGDFAQTNTCGTSLAVGANCTISVTSTPKTVGAKTGTLTITSNACGSPNTLSLTGTGIDFSIAATPASATVKQGDTATYTVTVTPATGGFPNAVALTASGLPAGAAATFTPASVTPGNSPATSSLKITTTAGRAFLPPISFKTAPPVTLYKIELSALLLALLALTGMKVGPQRLRRWAQPVLLAAVLVTVAGLISGCNGGFPAGGPSGTPRGTYTVTITGTSGTGTGALTHSSTVVLIVQ